MSRPRQEFCGNGHDMSEGSPNVGVRFDERNTGSQGGDEGLARFCITCQKIRARASDERARLSKRMRQLKAGDPVLRVVAERGLHDLSGAAGLIAVQGWISG